MFVVFDLDGTLADDMHRQHFLLQYPKDWDRYLDACADDAPIQPVIALAKTLDFAGWRFEVWTGRSERVREETEAWLKRHNLNPSKVLMRAEGDYRPDSQLKGGWLAETYKKPDIIVDDRNKSVAFWRAQGITCLQVADHDY